MSADLQKNFPQWGAFSIPDNSTGLKYEEKTGTEYSPKGCLCGSKLN